MNITKETINLMKTLFKPFHLFLILALVLSCGNISSNKKNTISLNSDNMLKFKKFSYIDTQGTGSEAYSFLMPSDWKFEGGIKWIPEQVAMPCSNTCRVYNPAGHEEFEGFANQCYFWSTNKQLFLTNPPGSKYFGSKVVKPVNAVTALQDIIKMIMIHSWIITGILAMGRNRMKSGRQFIIT